MGIARYLAACLLLLLGLTHPAGAGPLPVTAPQSFTVPNGHPLIGNVLTYDFDPDGDTLTALPAFGSYTQHGSLVVNSDGRFVYGSVAGFVGTDSFEYLAVDPSGDSSTGTVTIEVTDAGPVANPDTYVMNPGDPPLLMQDVLTNDTPLPGFPLHAEIITSPQHGYFEWHPGNAAPNIPPDGTFLYTP